MSGCSDRELGQLLHDYELGLLSDEDNHRFEMHLYDCDYCLARVREFTDISKILVKDPDVRVLVAKAAGESGFEKGKKKHSPLLKLVIAAILVVIIAIPIYRYGIYKQSPNIIQTLELLPTRSGGNDIVYLDKGGEVNISFYVNDGFQRRADILIVGITGDTVLFKKDFSDITNDGLGKIVLPVSSFSEGHYELILKPVSDSTAIQDIQYMFRVK